MHEKSNAAIYDSYGFRFMKYIGEESLLWSPV